MIKFSLKILIACVLLLLPLNSLSQEVYVEFGTPLLILLKPEEADKIRALVASAPFDQPYKSMIATADSALTQNPDPISRIRYEGLVSNHPDRIESVKHLFDMVKIYNLTWAYFVTKDEKYSNKAIEFIEAWADTYVPSGNDVNDNKMEQAMVGFHMLREVMKSAQKEKISAWVKSIGVIQKNKWKDKPGNRALKRLKLIYFAAYLAEDQTIIDWVQQKIEYMWKVSVYEDGKSADLIKRDATHYHYSTVKNMLSIAQIGRMLDKDHYSFVASNGGSIANSIDYTMPYVTREEVHPEWTNSTVKLDKERWDAGDTYYEPGKPWDPYEAYDALLSGATFDDTLFTLAENLRELEKEPLPWLAVMSRATLDIPI